MKSVLQARQFWLIVNGDEESPGKPDSSVLSDQEFKTARKEWIDWLSRDQAVMGSIKGACEDTQLPL